MSDPLSVLEAACKKLSTKVEKLRAQLEAAETELHENQTAIRVLSRLSESGGADQAKGSSQEQVLEALPMEAERALTPREVHQALQQSGAAISSDNVRTILSRLKGSNSVTVTDGRYWRQPPPPLRPSSMNGGDFDIDDDEIDSLIGRTQPSAVDDDDLDSDVPF